MVGGDHGNYRIRVAPSYKFGHDPNEGSESIALGGFGKHRGVGHEPTIGDHWSKGGRCRDKLVVNDAIETFQCLFQHVLGGMGEAKKLLGRVTSREWPEPFTGAASHYDPDFRGFELSRWLAG
jgi:hypothetical protein